MTNTFQTELVNLRDLARHFRKFGITQAWLRNEAEAERLPYLRAGRRMLFNITAVEEALLKRAGMKDQDSE